MPVDLVARSRAAGCFRMAVPRSHGGDGASLLEYMRLVRELSRVDGSVGWTMMIGSSAPVIFGHLPPDTFDAVYAAGPERVAGGLQPDRGGHAHGRRLPRLRAVGLRQRLPARRLVRGPLHGGGEGRRASAAVADDGRPAGDVDILDTWWVSGLCGTGSHDFTLDAVFVPEHYTFSLFEESGLPGPLGRIPEISVASLGFANVALGIAEGALGEITTLASGKVPMLASSTLAGNPLFRYRLGEADALLRAATALLDSEVSSAWAAASAGEEFDPAAAGPDPGHSGVGDRRCRPGRRRRLHGGRWLFLVLGLPAAAAPAGRACRHPALRRQGGPAHDRRCRPRRRGR